GSHAVHARRHLHAARHVGDRAGSSGRLGEVVMALLPTKQRDQVMVLISALILGLTGAYFVYVWQPKNTELADVQLRLDTLNAVNEKAKREVQRGSVAQLKRQSEDMARDLEVMRHLVPTSN